MSLLQWNTVNVVPNGQKENWGSCRFRPMPSSSHIDSTIDQVLKNYPSLADKKKDNIVRTMKQNRRTHVDFSFINPPKVSLYLSSLRHGTHKAEGDWRTRSTEFRANSVGANSPWGETGIIQIGLY